MASFSIGRSSISRLIAGVPLPLFGNAASAAAFASAKAKSLPRFAGWVPTLGAGALWFIWPAVDDGWKVEVGILPDPEAAAAAAEEPRVELSPEAKAKIEGAYMSAPYIQSEDDTALVKAVDTGDWSYFEEKWEAFAEKSGRPGEDDDDDDDDDDEDDDDEDDDEEDEEEGEDNDEEEEEDDDDDDDDD